MSVKTSFSLLLILALSGCCSYMPNDVMFEVKGVAPRDAKCELNLLFEGQVISTEDLEDLAVDKSDSFFYNFNTVFFVSFCERSYNVQVVCDRKVVLKKAVIFPNKYTQQPLDLGILPSKPLKEH